MHKGFCFAVLCCGYTLTDFPISIRLTSLALWQSNDCPSASKATLMNMDKYFMWIHYERLHNHNKAKHNKTVCIFLGIYCMFSISNFSGRTQCNHWISKVQVNRTRRAIPIKAKFDVRYFCSIRSTRELVLINPNILKSVGQFIYQFMFICCFVRGWMCLFGLKITHTSRILA